MRSFEEDAKLAEQYHGHLCSGQCIGVKMARYGLSLLGLDPETDRKKIAVYVECDRCPADAIAAVTGCRVGKRTYRWYDYGKIAASFVNLETNEAVRISRKRRMHPGEGEDMVAFYKDILNETLFTATRVKIDIKPGDRPGPPVGENVICTRCGEAVTDDKHIVLDGQPVCRACHAGTYYSVIDE